MEEWYPLGEQKQEPVHEIEDMRRKKQAATPQTTRKKPRKKHRAAIGVCLVLALFCGSLLAADLLIPQGVASYVSTAFAKQPDMAYAVCIGSYDTLDQARAVSQSVREMGGAGFVAFDGKYNVLLAAYPTQEEAKKVASKGGYSLFGIRTEGANENDFPLFVRSSVKGLIGYHVSVFEQLCTWSAQLAEKGTTVDYVKQRVQAIRSGLQQNATAFLDATKEATDAMTLNYRSVLSGVLGALQNLESRACSDNLYLAELRWTAILVLRINRA